MAHAATVQEVEPIAAKGKAEAVSAYLLRSVRREVAIVRRPTARMIGRAFVEESAGDAESLERVVRPLYDETRQNGEVAYVGSYAALLAHAVLDLGRVGEALQLSDVSRSVSTNEDYDAQVGWRSARGLAMAASGEPIEAETLLREAIEIVEATEDINLLGVTLLALAKVVGERGRQEEAEMLIDRAADLFDTKGSGAGVARIERLRESLGASGGSPGLG